MLFKFVSCENWHITAGDKENPLVPPSMRILQMLKVLWAKRLRTSYFEQEQSIFWCTQQSCDPIVYIRVRYDRWIKEVKTHFLQP